METDEEGKKRFRGLQFKTNKVEQEIRDIIQSELARSIELAERIRRIDLTLGNLNKEASKLSKLPARSRSRKRISRSPPKDDPEPPVPPPAPEPVVEEEAKPLRKLMNEHLSKLKLSFTQPPKPPAEEPAPQAEEEAAPEQPAAEAPPPVEPAEPVAEPTEEPPVEEEEPTAVPKDAPIAESLIIPPPAAPLEERPSTTTAEVPRHRLAHPKRARRDWHIGSLGRRSKSVEDTGAEGVVSSGNDEPPRPSCRHLESCNENGAKSRSLSPFHFFFPNGMPTQYGPDVSGWLRGRFHQISKTQEDLRHKLLEQQERLLQHQRSLANWYKLLRQEQLGK
eukprot:Blabericola_migrator_1__800@NODE_119_length_13646_cov_70_025112_g107_i0_p5_GENE_NODE_119_length_13646_cov_70_025112_g107_i0NODE_119_length_13646_cov_70_025112_g107_i0_p5_ORF_typecomplete_len336_score81_56_NODE_119_length_13646_cov_70_025112_g107_i011202127